MTASILDQWLCWFQSSPARGGGCNEVEAVVVADAREVSILTRPWGRVQRRGRVSRLGAIPRFNPHPPVGAGATAPKPPEANIIYVVSILTRPWGQVQPRAAERPRHDVVVSILTRPWGRVQPQRPEDGGAGFRVSILTRPWGRVQLITVGQHAYINVSILTRPWGRVQRSFPSLLYTLARFQSSPARGGGCNAHPLAHARRIPQVSILTRPWGRVQRYRRLQEQTGNFWFQSSPARGGGCNGSQTSRGVADDDSFNPHPPVGAGATNPKRRAHPSMPCFNPHPPVGVGATAQQLVPPQVIQRFNPHPPVGAGAT